MKRSVNKYISWIIIYITILLLFSYKWLGKTFGFVSLDAVIWHLLNPLKGTESGMIIKYLTNPLLSSIIFMAAILIAIKIVYKVPYKLLYLINCLK